MLLYMIRHGESEANAGKLHAGWAQISLTENGARQARLAGERLKGIPFDRIVCSDLQRAVQTCRQALPSRAFETNALLREISVGALSGKSAADCQRLYGESYAENKHRQNFTPYGGENRRMLLDRVRRFMYEAAQYSEKTIAVFAHEGTLRAMLDLVTDQAQKKERILCENCCIAVFKYENGLWQLLKWGV